MQGHFDESAGRCKKPLKSKSQSQTKNTKHKSQVASAQVTITTTNFATFSVYTVSAGVDRSLLSTWLCTIPTSLSEYSRNKEKTGESLARFSRETERTDR